MSKVSTALHGGTSLLDKSDKLVIDAELAEKLENPNEREKDQLSAALQTLLDKHPGAYMTNQMFDVPVEGSRTTDITFDRYYFQLNLLVMFYPEPRNDGEKYDTEKDRDEKAAFAKTRGFKFLPILGQADGQQILAALA